MNRVYVLSKRRFDDLMKQKGFNDDNIETRGGVAAFISINSTFELGDDEKPWFNTDHDNVLHLWFEDILEDYEFEKEDGTKGIYKAFNEEQGRQVIEFLNKNKDKETLIVHCAAGISRSAAVGIFAADYFNIDYNQFTKDNPLIHPNRTVLTILRRLTDANFFRL